MSKTMLQQEANSLNQKQLLAEEIINDFLSIAEPKDFKYSLDELFSSFMSSDEQWLLEYRQSIFFNYKNLVGLLGQIEEYSSKLQADLE